MSVFHGRIIFGTRIYVFVRAAIRGECQTITLAHPAMIWSRWDPLARPWLTCWCGWLLAPPLLWFLSCWSSQNIIGSFTPASYYHVIEFCYREKFLKLRENVGIRTTTATSGVFSENEDGANEDQDIKSSSVSGDFENVFPYKEQIEHFLSATRELRKSRENNKYYYTLICLDFSCQKQLQGKGSKWKEGFLVMH